MSLFLELHTSICTRRRRGKTRNSNPLTNTPHTHRTDQDFCFPKSVGYKPADIMQRIDPTTHFAQHTASTINNLTGSLVLHPITCALAFIAFVLSCGAGVVGSLLAASVGGLAWALAVVSVGVDFWLFGVCFLVSFSRPIPSSSPLLSFPHFLYPYVPSRRCDNLAYHNSLRSSNPTSTPPAPAYTRTTP